jgi:hypothetical protein
MVHQEQAELVLRILALLMLEAAVLRVILVRTVDCQEMAVLVGEDVDNKRLAVQQLLVLPELVVEAEAHAAVITAALPLELVDQV